MFASPEVEVRTAGSVAEGVGRLNAERPDVVVLDLHLPDGSGLDLLDQIRATDPKLPVILFSAQEAGAATSEASRLGAFGYLAKPADLDRMSDLLGKAFQAARSLRAAAGKS